MEQTKLTGYPSVDKPWLKYYTEEAINAPLPECTIYEYLVENNRAYPKDIAIHYLGRRITYGELFKRIDETAAAFAALGVAPGEIVTVALPSIPEALYCVYALNKIGAVANMIHPLAGTDELIHYLNEVESRIAILFDGTYKLIEKRIGETKLKHAIVVSAGESLLFGLKQFYYANNPKVWLPQDSVFRSWAWFQKGGKGTTVPAYAKNPDTLALISHTGGTTGEPKGVMCSDHNVNALICQIVCNFEHKRQSTCLASLPPFINYSLIESMLAMLAIGFKVVLIPKYESEKLGVYIKRYKPYVNISIPAYWEALLKTENIRSVDMSCLRYAIYGGEAMSVENERAVNELLQSCHARGQLCKGLGSTEMMAAATSTYEGCNTEGCAGVPLVHTNCMLVDPDTLTELSYGQTGEICFSGPTLMMGYYHNPEATDAIVKLHKDGCRWLHTGDLGYMDENGVLFVTGRIKRILMTKGRDGNMTKLFPDRIEKVIGQHPAVAVNCAIGVPDPERVHIPVAYIVPNEDRADCERIEKELRELCKTQLPEYMWPDRFVFVDELPRTSRGKIDYRALEERAVKEA
jgi:long-chain acyl-CoA synthetase